MIAAQNKGEIRRDINPQFILYFLKKMAEIAGDEQIINLYEFAQSLNADQIILIFLRNFYKKRMEDK